MDREIVDEWLATVSPASAVIYRPVVEGFLARAFPKTLVTLDSETVGVWPASLEGLETTRARKVSTVSSFLQYAHRNGHVGEDLSLALKRPEIPKRAPKADGDVGERIVLAAEPGRDRVILRLLYEHHLSVEEIGGLRVKHVGSWLQTRGRDVRLPPDLLEEIRGFMGTAPEDPVFYSKRRRNRALGVRDVREVVYRAAEKAGYDRVSSSILRRASLFKGSGITPTGEHPYGYIYGLYDVSGALRYVGQTTTSLEARMRQHLTSDNLTKRNRVVQWLREIIARGEQPIMKALATAKDRDELYHLERQHISKARQEGAQLVNSTHLRWEEQFTRRGEKAPVIDLAKALAGAIEAHLKLGLPDPTGRLKEALDLYRPCSAPRDELAEFADWDPASAV